VLRRLLLAAAAGLALAVPAATAATPVDVSGELNGAPYRIVAPANWNGTLLVHAHGYRDAADHPGEVDDRSAPVSPNAALEPFLLAQGYALTGSAYASNGWAVQDGISDTKRLVSHFRETVGQPSRTLLWGFSMGSIVTFALAEQTAGHFDGYLAACAVAAGTPRAWDGSVANSLAYDAAFGWGATWGSVGDVRDDLDFETSVLPKMIPELSNPLNFGKFEFIRLVTGAAPSAFPAPSFPGWIVTNMFFSTEARAELERRAGGPVGQNLSHVYSLSAADKAYLAILGVNADALLAHMNANRTVSAPPFARNYVEHWADYSGKIKKPMLTLHTQTDTLVPTSHESAYAATVAAAGKSDLLAQTYTTGNGHCNFTGPQLLTTIGALDAWVATGAKPTAASFPAALGFIPGFVAPPWPQQ
jgi:pimeloyl-ACP methyl ester carboxylesterase